MGWRRYPGIILPVRALAVGDAAADAEEATDLRHAERAPACEDDVTGLVELVAARIFAGKPHVGYDRIWSRMAHKSAPRVGLG